MKIFYFLNNTFQSENYSCYDFFSRNLRGFTLVDLLTTMSVLMIIACIGIPNMTGWLHSQAQSTVFNTLHHLCALARTRAIKDNNYMTVCASDDLTKCGGLWNKTVIVFSDSNKNEQVDNNDVLYKAITLPGTTPCIEWNSGARRQHLQFKPSGATNGTAGHFKFCNPTNLAIQKKLVVSFNGRTSIKKL